MVSMHRTIISITAASFSLLSAQQPSNNPVSFPSTEGLRPSTSAEATAPQRTLTLEQRGDIYMARKMFREAIDTYIAAKPETAVLANKLGIAYHQTLDLERAKKYYERAIKMDGKYAEAVNNLGTIQYAQKRYGRAVSLYNRALKLSPESASIYSNLGTAEFGRKRYKQAVAAYEKALILDPDVFERRNSHGVLLQERSVDERAKFHYYMAKTYAKAGATERALLYIRKALEEGFKERDKFREEPEFATLQTMPEFEQLMTLQPRVL